MTAIDLIKEVEDHGGHIVLRRGGIKVTAKNPLPEALVQTLKEAKLEIVSYLKSQESPRKVCGQCATIIKEGQEFLNVIADGFPGFLHLGCYDDWHRDHLVGRYPGS